jgi:L-seryl-tRNA(Ser) seleniumtransferase
MNTPMNDLQKIPAVDTLLNHAGVQNLIGSFGREITLKALRSTLDDVRSKVKNGDNTPSSEEIIRSANDLIETWLQPSLVPVINASGIILHTNLGRAPLSQATMAAMQTVALGYSNLEYDLAAGKRGKRSIHAEVLLQRLTGAESALVVNNNAAAVLLVLSALSHGKRVITAHSQLVEIGGGFRVPDVLRQSGAKLVAVGTTNRVHISDYEQALQETASLVLVTHHSNFKITGFTSEPKLSDVTNVAHSNGIPLVYDLGSGALLDTSLFGLGHEPTVQEALDAGADIICFSGDKLLGGPQAGIIIGRKELLDKIKRHPLARAVRADKLCLVGINATLTHYLKGEALSTIPVWQMIAMEVPFIQQRIEQWKEILGVGEIMAGVSMIGGGSLPEECLPTCLLALEVKNPNGFLEKLRRLPLPIIARIENECVMLDARTVLIDQDQDLLAELKTALA